MTIDRSPGRYSHTGAADFGIPSEILVIYGTTPSTTTVSRDARSGGGW